MIKGADEEVTTIPESRTVTGFGTAMMTETADPRFALPPLSCGFPAESVAVTTARHVVRERYGGCGPLDSVDDLELVVTELVANAVAASAPESRVRLRIHHLQQAVLLVEVFDEALAVPKRRCPQELGEDGRGLLLVTELSLAWGWHRVDGGKVVWSLFSLVGAAGTEEAPEVGAAPAMSGERIRSDVAEGPQVLLATGDHPGQLSILPSKSSIRPARADPTG